MAYVVVTTKEEAIDAASVVYPLPPEVQENDLVMFFIANDNGATTISSVGYSEPPGTAQAIVGNARGCILYKIAGASESDPTINFANAKTAIACVIVRDADTTTPFDIAAQTDHNTSVNAADCPSVTPASNDCLVFRALAGWDGIRTNIMGPLDERFLTRAEYIDFDNVKTLVSVNGQSTAAATGTYTFLFSNSLTDRGSTYTLCVKNKSGGAKPIIYNSGVEEINRYGNHGANHTPVTWTTLGSSVTTIDGLSVETGALTATPTVAFANLTYKGSVGTQIQFSIAAPDPGTWQGATHPVTMDADGKFILVTLALGAVNRSGAKGVVCVIFDSVGNWEAYNVPLSNLNAKIGRSLTFSQQTTPVDNSGTVDWSDITKVGYAGHRFFTGTSADGPYVKDLTILGNDVFAGGGADFPISPSVYYSYTAPDPTSSVGFAELQGSSQVLMRKPAQLGDGTAETYFKGAGQSLELPPESDPFWISGPISTPIVINASASCTMDFSLLTLNSNQAQAFTIDPGSSTSATYDFSNTTLSGWDVTWKTGVTCNGAAFLNSSRIDAEAATFDGCSVSESRSTTSAMIIENGADLLDCTFTKGDETYGVEIATAGAHDFTGTTFTGYASNSDLNVTAATGTVTITLASGQLQPSYTSAGATVTFVQPVTTYTLDSGEAGTTFRLFATGTQTLLDSATGSSLAYDYTGTVVVDWEVYKAGKLFQRQSGVTLTDTTVSLDLVDDPVYDSAHGLAYPADASYNRVTKKLTVSTTQGGDDIYSLLIDSFISEAGLYNTEFPIQMNGASAAIFVDDAEIIDTTSLNKWRRVGIQYLDSGDVVTAEYSAVFTLSSGIPGSAQAEYQQTAGTGTTDAINTGDIDELIQIYGDATHGNFTKNTHLVVKYQENTYRESRVDVLGLYGITTLQSVAYPIPTPVNPIGITAGDPVITGVTITNHGATPVSWDAGNGAKDYSLTITDTGANSGGDILRWLNYFMSLDATFQGEDPFNWPYMVEADGTKYRTERGIVEGSAGATLKGVRVIDGSSDPHPDFSEFTADDGTLGIPPVVNSVSITNLPTDGANIMLQIYNITTATEIYAADPGGATYSDTYTEGTDYTQGDEVRVRFAELNGATSFKRFETIVTAGAEGWSLNANNFIEEDAVYAINAVDGSTVTKFVYTPVNDQFNLSVAQNFVAAELFAYYCFVLTTAAGIDGAYGSFEAQDAGNYKNITAIANIFLDNETTASQRQTDSARIYKDDGTYPVLDPTTSGFGIDINWQNVVYVVSTGGSSLTPSESAQLFATATQTNLDVVDANVDQLLLDTAQISTDIDGIPDAILNRNIATGSNGGRTVQDVMRANRNRVVIDPIGNTITVYEEDDITVAWSGAITTGDRDPINAVDPA
jgi:hypothetical protein